MRTILIVDDEADNLITFRALAIDTIPDVDAIVCDNGRDAISLARTRQPDTIFLDIRMPGLDGFEVCERLKGDPETCDIPVVFVTAYFESDEIKYRAIDVGSEGFLQKPISIPNFIATIRSMLRIRDANLEKKTERDRLSAMVEQKTSELKRAQRAMLSLLEDLTSENASRKSAETELATRNEYLDSVIQTTQDGFSRPRATDGSLNRTGVPRNALDTDQPFRRTWDSRRSTAITTGILRCHPFRIEACGHATLTCEYSKRTARGCPSSFPRVFSRSNPRFIFFCRDLSERNPERPRCGSVRAVRARAENGIHRPAGWRRRARFQQYARRHPGQSEFALSEMAPGSQTYNRLMEIRAQAFVPRT
jgi:CheY-like chemotaxis protein